MIAQWDFTVKRSATTIREDSAAYAVSTSSSTMEVETRAFLWIVSGGDSQTTHAIILTDSVSWLQNVKSGMQSPD